MEKALKTLTWNQVHGAIAAALKMKLRPCYVSSEFLATGSPAEWDLRASLLGDKSHMLCSTTVS